VREVGKVMGLSEDVCAAIASNYWGSHGGRVREERREEMPASTSTDPP
jgi:hypothetical protein